MSEQIDRRTLQHPMSPRREIARDLKRQGMTYQQIADQMNISRQRAQQLVRPTDKKRKAQIEASGGQCQSCGKRAKKLDAHHDDYDGAPTRLLCVPCHKAADAVLGLTRHAQVVAISTDIGSLKSEYHERTAL